MTRATARPTAPAGAAGLTPREREVLSLLVDGKRTGEIAADMHISPKTVSTHIEHIMRKLGTLSQAQTIAIAVRERHIDTPRRTF